MVSNWEFNLKFSVGYLEPLMMRITVIRIKLIIFFFSFQSFTVQIIVERYSKETELPHLEKRKFLVPQEFTMSQFISIIRSRMKVGPTKALFFLVNNRSLVSLSKSLAEIYAENRSEDGFLYIHYASQEVFG